MLNVLTCTAVSLFVALFGAATWLDSRDFKRSDEPC
jgi:hypothetical protein